MNAVCQSLPSVIDEEDINSAFSAANDMSNFRDLVAKREVPGWSDLWPFSRSRTHHTPRRRVSKELDRGRQSLSGGGDIGWKKECGKNGNVYQLKQQRHLNASKAVRTRVWIPQKRSISWVTAAMLSFCTEDPCRCSKCDNSTPRKVRGRQ